MHSVGSDTAVQAPNAILYCPRTSETLFEKNAGVKRPMASLTKIMTMIIAGDMLEAGLLDWSESVAVSDYAAAAEGSRLGMDAGRTISVEDCLKAISLASANDCAVALAEHISGSEERFVELMNKKASKLGLENTRFVNCFGLDVDGHYSSAGDVALMSKELLKYPSVSPLLSLKKSYIYDGKAVIFSTNELLGKYDGIIGVKTGTTSAALNCFSAAAEKNGITLIAVVMGCRSSEERFIAAAGLLDYGFDLYDKNLGNDIFWRLLTFKGKFVPVINKQYNSWRIFPHFVEQINV